MIYSWFIGLPKPQKWEHSNTTINKTEHGFRSNYVYTTDSTDISNINQRDPILGVHKFIIFELSTLAKKLPL